MAHMQDGIDGILPVFVGDFDCAWSDHHEPADQMTYVAWEVKNRKEPQSPQGKHIISDERQGQERCTTLAGPKHEHVGGAQGLTSRAMLALLLDRGTSSALAAGRRDAKDAEHLEHVHASREASMQSKAMRAGVGHVRVVRMAGSQCMRLCIRGAELVQTYPCLDEFEMRSVFVDFLRHVADEPAYELHNTLLDPLWNDRVHPTGACSAQHGQREAEQAEAEEEQ